MQSILTRFYGPTNSKGARIKAECDRGSIWVCYPYELWGDAVHRFAVDALLERFRKEDQKAGRQHAHWDRPYVTGQLCNGDFAHVFTH